MNFLKKCVLSIFLILLAQLLLIDSSKASHGLGGYIQINYLNNFDYEISVIGYEDDSLSNNTYGDSLALLLISTDGLIIYDTLWLKRHSTTLSNCYLSQYTPAVKALYSDTFAFDTSVYNNEYLLVSHDVYIPTTGGPQYNFRRSILLTNMYNSSIGRIPVMFVAKFKPNELNSTPSVLSTFDVGPGDLNRPYFHNFEASDSENDSIRFSFSTPFASFDYLASSNTTVAGLSDAAGWWDSPASFFSVYNIDPSGTLIFLDNSQRFTTYGVKMEEIRNGQVISTVYLDLPMLIKDDYNSFDFNFIPDSLAFTFSCNSVPNNLITTDSSLVDSVYQTFWYDNNVDLINYGEYFDIPGFGNGTQNFNVFVKNKYNCKIKDSSLSVTITPNINPIITIDQNPTCDSCSVLRITNYSPFSSYILYGPGPSLQLTTDSIEVCNSGNYYVYAQSNNDSSCNGNSNVIAFTSYSMPNTSISSTGPNTIDCINGSNFPTLSLNSQSNFINHTFQWHFTNIYGVTSIVPFATTNQYVANHPGDFFLVTTDTLNGCVDTSNVITILLFAETEPFSISLEGDTILCQGETLNISLTINPEITQPIAAPFWTYEVYNGSTLTGASLNSINGDGDYWVIITNPVGCVYFTDTINVNIDTLPIPDDNIALVQPYNGNGIYCFGDTVAIQNFDYPTTATHSLYINGNFQSNIFTNSAIHYIIPPYVGMNNIHVISTFGNDCFDTLFDYSAFVLNDVCCTNLDSLKILYGILDSTVTYDQKYLVIDDLFTENGGNYWFEGTFYFMGNGFRYPDDFGGESTGPNLYLADSSINTFNGAELLAFCDTMWGGILLGNAADIGIEHSLIQDSYFGIRPNVVDLNDAPSGNEYYKMVGSDNTFNNNYISVTVYANLAGPKSAIFGDFMSDPETMHFPFDYNSNGEIYSYSYKAIDIYQGNGLTFTNLSDNLNWIYGDPNILNNTSRISISDHVYGVYLNAEAIIDTIATLNIYRPVVAGIYSKNKARELVIGFDTIYVQSDPTYDNWQFEHENAINPYLNNKTYGVISEEREIVLEQSLIYGDEGSFLVGFAKNKSVGLKSKSDAVIRGNSLNSLDFALQPAKATINYDLDSNVISRNVVGINVTELAKVDIDLGCNHFIKHSSNDFTQYGILVDEGSQITDDFGWDFSFPNTTTGPAGNSWPVDSLKSSGYPFTTTGDPGFPEVYLWTPPQEWYSIYDANAGGESDHQGYDYHRWNNEFIGEDQKQSNWASDAIYPSIMIDPFSGNTSSSPCVNSPGIIYPLQIILGSKEDLENSDILLFPIPTKSELIITGLNENGNRLSLMDLKGTIVFKSAISNNQNVNLSQISSGVYIVQIMNKNGEILKRQKLIKK